MVENSGFPAYFRIGMAPLVFMSAGARWGVSNLSSPETPLGEPATRSSCDVGGDEICSKAASTRPLVSVGSLPVAAFRCGWGRLGDDSHDLPRIRQPFYDGRRERRATTFAWEQPPR